LRTAFRTAFALLPGAFLDAFLADFFAMISFSGRGDIKMCVAYRNLKAGGIF
jgi:hypothetical protein